jgi:hypothetical protein
MAAALLAGCGAASDTASHDRDAGADRFRPADRGATDREGLPFTGGGSGRGVVRQAGSAANAGGGRSSGVAARIVRPTVLRSRPGGRPVVQVPLETAFGSRQIVAVVGRRRGWLAVLHPAMPNGRAGWIPAGAARLHARPISIDVDLSRRTAHVRIRGRAVDRFRVGVGRPGSPTPTGRFAVTDRLVPGPGLPYGCCILALTARQQRLPAGWTGGDRIAFHGVADESRVGRATSAGCLHVRERDLRVLIRRVRAGARVTVRA